MISNDVEHIKTIPFVKNNGIYYNINFTQYYPKNAHVHSLQSSYILAAAIATGMISDDIIPRVLDIQKKLGINATLWGLRSENDTFSLEFYFHHPKKFKKHTLENLADLLQPYMTVPISAEMLEDGYYIISYNLSGSNIECLNVYYPLIDPSKPLAEVDDAGFSLNVPVSVAASYYFTPSQPALQQQNIYYGYTNCIRDLYDVIERIYSCCREVFPNEDPIKANQFLSFPYLYDKEKNRYFHPYCIAKKEYAVGVYFMGFSFAQFLSFLKYHRLPLAFIASIEKEGTNLNHLQFDIGIDFILQNGEFIVKKIAHFGTF